MKKAKHNKKWLKKIKQSKNDSIKKKTKNN